MEAGSVRSIPTRVRPLHPKSGEQAFCVVLAADGQREETQPDLLPPKTCPLSAVVTVPLGVLSHETDKERLLGERLRSFSFGCPEPDSALGLPFDLGHERSCCALRIPTSLLSLLFCSSVFLFHQEKSCSLFYCCTQGPHGIQWSRCGASTLQKGCGCRA